MATNIHVTALDGIVNVNSLFTLAVFIGLAWNPTDPTTTLTPTVPTCAASPSIAEHLVTFHVYSFSSFLFSSLIALALKQAIRIVRSDPERYDPSRFYPSRVPDSVVHVVNKNLVRVGMLVSGIGSVCGSVFLMLALVNVVQFKVGSLACGSSHAFAAVVPLLVLVPSALLVYVAVVLYAFTR